MKPVFIRPAKPEEAPEVVDWTVGLQARNLADPDVFSYPATVTLKAFTREKGLAYVPRQLVFMLEALALCPQNTATENAAALKAVVIQTVDRARELGIGEVCFLCSDEETVKFAQHHEFKKVTSEKVALYRMKIPQ